MGYRLMELWKGRCREEELEDESGPRRPDVAVTDPDGSLVVLSAREKPGWDEVITVRVEEGQAFPDPVREALERAGYPRASPNRT